MLLLLLPLATKNWNLSKATKQWNLSRTMSIGTSIGHQVGIFFHLLPSPSLEKVNLDHLKLFFPDIIFDSNLENICSHNFLSWEEEND